MADDGTLTMAGRRGLSIWVTAVGRHAFPVVAILCVLTALAVGYTVRNLAINTSTTDMISPETSFRRNAIAFDQAFPQFKDLIVIVVDAPTPEKAAAAARQLVMGMRARPGLFETVDWPAGDPFFAQNGLLYRSADALSELGDRLAKAEPLLATLAQQPNLIGLFDVLTLALRDGGADPAIGTLLAGIESNAFAGASGGMSWRDLIALGGGRRQVIVAKPVIDSDSLSPAGEALAEIRILANRIDSICGKEIPIGSGMAKKSCGLVFVGVTGSAALDQEELDSAALGGKTAGLVSLCLVTILLIVGLRSVSLIIPALLTLIAGLFWTAAFAALAIGHLNLISVAFAVLFVGLGIDFSIHFCLRYREALQETGRANGPLGTAAGDVGGSLAIGALCAALGFLAFWPTDYRGLAELGIISAGGMMIALFLNLTLLPALLTLFPDPKPCAPKRLVPARGKDRGRMVLTIAIGLGVLGAVFGYRADFDFNPMNLKDPESPSVRAFYRLAEDTRNGVYAIDLLAPDRRTANAEAKRLSALTAVGAAITIDDLIPDNQDEKLAIIEDIAIFLAPVLVAGERPSEPSRAQKRAALADFQAFLAEYSKAPSAPFADVAKRTARALEQGGAREDIVAFEQRLVGHLPNMLADLNTALNAAPVTLDNLPGRIRDSWLTADGRARIQLLPAKTIEHNDDLRRFANAVLAAAPTAVGTPVTITEAGDAVVTAFQQATLYAFAAVCILLLIVLRSIRDAALVIFPLILAAIYTGATAVLLGLPFNFANVIVLPLLFGLGVASGIHLVIRARHANDTATLMRSSTPRAVLFSALTTIASFGSLALSGHRGMTSMGQLLTIAILYTLICALVVLPATLRWIERRAAP